MYDVYIYRERERERERDVHVHVQHCSHESILPQIRQLCAANPYPFEKGYSQSVVSVAVRKKVRHRPQAKPGIGETRGSLRLGEGRKTSGYKVYIWLKSNTLMDEKAGNLTHS